MRWLPFLPFALAAVLLVLSWWRSQVGERR
jgi:hypothetical protein